VERPARDFADANKLATALLLVLTIMLALMTLAFLDKMEMVVSSCPSLVTITTCVPMTLATLLLVVSTVLMCARITTLALTTLAPPMLDASSLLTLV
jgi:hypothetical protein